MDILIKILQFILSLSLLVIVHEFGHFLFARIFKTRVEKFYLFFNPWFSLFKFRKGETEYGVGWIPFGGYVKISGMIDESMDTDQMKQPVQPYEFRAKPGLAAAAIMVGGVVMNIVLALLIYIGMSWAWGKTYLDNENVKYGYAYGELAKRIGFRDGDRIVDINGKPLDDAAKLLPTIVFDQAEYVTVERDGKQERIGIPAEAMAELLNCADFAEPRIPFVVGRAVEGGEAAKAGLVAGDTLVSLNGEPMRYFDQYRRAFGQFKSDTVHVSVMRDSAGITKLLTLPVRVSDDGLIGVELTPPDRLLSLSTRNYTFWQAIPAGVRRTGEEIGSYAQADQADVHARNRSLQIAGRTDRDRKHIPRPLELDSVLAHHGLSVDRAGDHEYPADPGARRRTRAVPARRGRHRTPAERQVPRAGPNGGTDDPARAADLRQRERHLPVFHQIAGRRRLASLPSMADCEPEGRARRYARFADDPCRTHPGYRTHPASETDRVQSGARTGKRSVGPPRTSRHATARNRTGERKNFAFGGTIPENRYL